MVYDLTSIINTLRSVYNKYNKIALGITGSYARHTATSNSDIDIVIVGDSTRIDIAEYIKSLFKVKVDILWFDLLEKEDRKLDEIAASKGLEINKHSLYKNILEDIIWV